MVIQSTPAPEENLPFQHRLRALIVVPLAVMAIILVRAYYLNVVLGSDLYERSLENYVSQALIDAPRGSIRDRHGVLLATNQMIFNVVARPYKLSAETLGQSFARLQELTGRDFSTALTAMTSGRQRRPQTLIEGLDFERAAPIVERLEMMPGISVEPAYRRFYPEGTLAAHLLGFVGPIPPGRHKDLAEEGYALQDRIGLARVEALCETSLRGAKGVDYVRRDASGRVREILYDLREPARPGEDVALTIDLELQRAATELITTRSLELIARLQGATVTTRSRAVMIAMDPRDGAILAMASYPTFDPNRPAYAGTPDFPLGQYDYSVQGKGLMPGSAFKLITAYAALRAGIRPTRQIRCSGRFYLRGWNKPFMCDNRWGHGTLDLTEALQKSCNVYFFTLANELGQARLYEAALEWGFGVPTGLDINRYESRGQVMRSGLYPGEVLMLGIGQGRGVSTTPLQVLRAYAALANGGRLVQPHVVASVGGRPGPPGQGADDDSTATIELLPEWRETLVEGLWRTANVQDGTAYRARMRPEWQVVGKTSSVEQSNHRETNAWFVCFAPRDNPTIALLTMIENAGHGGDIAAPLCKEFLETYFSRYPLPTAPVVKEERYAALP